MGSEILRRARADGFTVATVDGYAIVLPKHQQHYQVCYAGWVVCTTPTYYAAITKIADCQEQLRSVASSIRETAQ